MRRLYLAILAPAFTLTLFLVELQRQNYTRILSPAWLVIGSLVSVAVCGLWLAYSHFLARFAEITPGAARRLDLLSYLPFLLLALYLVPAIGARRNAGTLLLALALGLCLAAKVAVLLYYRRAQVRALLSRPHLALGLTLGVGGLLRVNLIAAGRFHADEALYCYWARLIASGQDVFLRFVPVDKPPVLFYVLALFFRILGPTETAARLPNLMAGIAGLALLYAIARELYGRRVAVLSALFLALSPYDIQFAPTAFTDPLMVALSLAAGLLAVKSHSLWAGLAIGLAAATKPTALLFLPLILLAAVAKDRGKASLRQAGQEVLYVALGCGAVLALVAVWDALIRAGSDSFVVAGMAHYGGVDWVAPQDLWPRLGEWLRLVRYLTGAPALNMLLAVGVPALLAVGLWRRRQGWFCDWVLAAFFAGYLAVHTLLSFAVWDRYLLGLAPIAALLLARIVLLPLELLAALRRPAIGELAYSAVAAVLLVGAMLPATRTALRHGYPLGSDHGAYEGIDDVAAYLRGTAPAGSIVFHHWLGWHYSYYLFDAPFAFHYYPDPQSVLDNAQAQPEAAQYIVFPSWASSEELRTTLQGGHWGLRELYRTYRRDGSVSFTVYRLLPPSDTAPQR